MPLLLHCKLTAVQVLVLCSLLSTYSYAQTDTSKVTLTPIVVDTIAAKRDTTLSMDAVYNRPFLYSSGAALSVGGYAEANALSTSENGIGEGLTFQMRRFTLFVSSQPHDLLRFLAEIEFEGGTEEINLEYAALDMEFDPLLIARAGMIMNPIGTFNQNHDGPKWEFTNRPLSSTQMLPATWSNVGAGLHGKYYGSGIVYAYEVYVTGGFDDAIVSNDEGRTLLAASKENRERFVERSTGGALLTGKFATKVRGYGELGLSYMGGNYITGVSDGLEIDSARRVDVFAADFSTTITNWGTSIVAEAAMVLIDVPSTYSQQFGRKQFGGFLDVVQPVYKGSLLNFKDAVINVGVRFDYVDWNAGTFRETGDAIGDERYGITGAISFRPTAQTVLRFNYSRSNIVDLLGNEAIPAAEWTMGLSTYF